MTRWFKMLVVPHPTIVCIWKVCCCSVVSYFLRPHGLQHARLPWPSLSPTVCPNSCPLSQWCHLTISSTVVPFSSCLQSFPVSGSFPMSRLFASGGQSFSISPSNEHSWLVSFRMANLYSYFKSHLLYEPSDMDQKWGRSHLHEYLNYNTYNTVF